MVDYEAISFVLEENQLAYGCGDHQGLRHQMILDVF
jgi:hypothetical protein